MSTNRIRLLTTLLFAFASACARHSECTSCEHARAPGAHDHAHMQHDDMAATAPASDTSLFQLTSAFTDQNERPFTFESLRGHPTLVVMFYGSCTTVCPILLDDAKSIDAEVDAAHREKLRVLLVTFDPARDTAERLRAMGAEKHFDLSRWSMLRGTDSSVRELSMVLGVQYRKLASGDFSHTALITLLDPEGRIVERVEGLHADHAALVARIAAMP